MSKTRRALRRSEKRRRREQKRLSTKRSLFHTVFGQSRGTGGEAPPSFLARVRALVDPVESFDPSNDSSPPAEVA